MAQTTKIIDSHLHIFKPSQLSYHWLSSDSLLFRDIELTDIEEAMTSEGISGAVLVEATNTREEIAFLLDVAEKYPLNLAVIGWLDINDALFAEHLAMYAENPYFSGIRINCFESFSLTQTQYKAVELLEESGLVVDVLMNPALIDDVIAIATQFAEMNFVLNHFAGIPVREIQSDSWQEALEKLAHCRNIILKISHDVWAVDLPPVLDDLIDLFGIGRLLVGTNFPMFIEETNYSTVCRSLIEATTHLDDAAQSAILHDNAVRIYKIKSGAST